MTHASQRKAISNYRERLMQRGFKRFEVMACDTDRDLIRAAFLRRSPLVGADLDLLPPCEDVARHEQKFRRRMS